LAGLIVFSGRGEPLALVGSGFETIATALGAVAFIVTLAILYAGAARAGERSS
jgi:uncharacterized membrane protein YgdD (TMEM256/DUF423 family)